MNIFCYNLYIFVTAISMMGKITLKSLEEVKGKFTFLELIPDTHGWVKDTSGKFVYGNRLFFERFGISSVQGLIGKTDYDITSEDMATRYRQDDDLVLRGSVITNRLELIYGQVKRVEWFLTSKWPVYDHTGLIIGSFGISQHLNFSEREVVPFHDLRDPIEHIVQHFASRLPVSSIATACNISVSTLERRFTKHLGITPVQYIKEVRLENARRLLLDTDKSIGSIALETGFSDHSHLTRAFTRKFKKTPRETRKSRR